MSSFSVNTHACQAKDSCRLSPATTSITRPSQGCVSRPLLLNTYFPLNPDKAMMKFAELFIWIKLLNRFPCFPALLTAATVHYRSSTSSVNQIKCNSDNFIPLTELLCWYCSLPHLSALPRTPSSPSVSSFQFFKRQSCSHHPLL